MRHPAKRNLGAWLQEYEGFKTILIAPKNAILTGGQDHQRTKTLLVQG